MAIGGEKASRIPWAMEKDVYSSHCDFSLNGKFVFIQYKYPVLLTFFLSLHFYFCLAFLFHTMAEKNTRNNVGKNFDETDRLESIFECLRQRIANAENTIREERANAGRLTVDNAVLMGKVDNLEAEIINLHVLMEARDNELNGLYSLVEKLQKKMLDFNIPPSP